MFPYRQKRLKMRVQFILEGWRPLTIATELGAWPVYEAEDCGRGYDTMSGTSTEASLYLLLPGRGSRGQGGPGRQQQQNKWTKKRFTHSVNREFERYFYWIDIYLSYVGRQCFVLRCFIWLTVLNELDGNAISIKVSLILFVHFSFLRRRRMWRKWRMESPVQSLTGLFSMTV